MICFETLDSIFFTLYTISTMEPHPIPQNVTSFQFRLVGDMTLKQFAYLAIGSTIAYLLFVFWAAKYPILTWPLILISASSGLAFAFLPIGSRPLDHWLTAFLKAVYSPTKRTWQKMGKNYREDPLFNSRYVMYTSSLQPSLPPKAEMPPSPPQTPIPPQPLPSQEELGRTVDLARQAQQLQVRIIQAERALSQIKEESTRPTPIPVDYSQQVNKILSDLQKLVSEASGIRSQLDAVSHPQELVAESAAIPATHKEKIRVVLPIKPKPTQVALTTFPNVINGIVKDGRGNYLEGVVAVIFDKEGLPVRALKTNKLGQFSGSTPLPNDTYTLELEKEGFNFDVLQIELEGAVLPPLMITVKN